MPKYRFDQLLLCISITSWTPPPLGHMIDKFWEIRELMSTWNNNMYKHYIPSWICCLNESVLIWTNQLTCPGWIFIPCKPHLFGNEYHTIADDLTSILFGVKIVQGKDAPNVLVKFDDKGGSWSAPMSYKRNMGKWKSCYTRQWLLCTIRDCWLDEERSVLFCPYQEA